MDSFQGHARMKGPCGDTMEFWIQIENESVKKASFETDGCDSALACGSITSILAEGRSILAILRLEPEEVSLALGGLPQEYQHCALLAVKVLKEACLSWLNRYMNKDQIEEDGILQGIGISPEPVNRDTIHKEVVMKIAIPLADGKLSMHFGHCQTFALIDVDLKERKIVDRTDVDAPPHQPGLLPQWLAERGASLIIAGGMGQRAQGLFSSYNIGVFIGAPQETPEALVTEYLEGNLRGGQNICDH